MAAREASLRVTIRNAGFLAGMRQMTATAAAAGTKMGAAISGPMKAGLASAAGTMKTMMGGLVGHMKTAATLGGAFAIGKFVSDAVQMQGQYRNMAHQLEKITGEAQDWRAIMKDLQGVADDTGQGINDIARGYDTIISATGNYEYAQEQLAVIGKIATASGKDIGLLANVAEKVNRKFGLTGEEASAAIAQIASQTDIGGPSLEAFGNTFDIMATEAVNAGLKGKQGLGQLVGIMNQLDAQIGVEAPGALKEMFKAFDKTSPQMRALKKVRVGFQMDESADFAQRLRTIMEDPKLFASMEQTITGPAKRAFKGMTGPYREAYKKAISEGKSATEATDVALRKYDEFVASLNASGKTVEDFAADAEKRMKEDPTVIMKKALNKMAVAFQDPKMLGAIERMAKLLPGLADGFVKLMDWVMKNPLLAAGGYVGARLAISFAQGALVSAGTKIGAMASAWLNKTAPTTGAKIGLAAKVALVAAAAFIGFMIGKRIATAFWDEREQLDKGAASADITASNAMGSGNVDEQRAALEKVRNQIAAIEESRSGMLGGLKQFYHDASAAGASLVDPDVGYVDTQADSLAKLRRAQADLEASIKKQSDSQGRGANAADRTAQSMDRLAQSAKKLDETLGQMGNTPGSAPGRGGPPGGLHTGPGHAQ